VYDRFEVGKAPDTPWPDIAIQDQFIGSRRKIVVDDRDTSLIARDMCCCVTAKSGC
jgi:hypothetical protein